MLAYQRGQVTLQQYKVSLQPGAPTQLLHTPSSVNNTINPTDLSPQLLLCSLYKIYEALEEELDRNCSHDSVAPIYFPQELARLGSLRKDLEHFYGQNWREKLVVPAAALRYAQRLREVPDKVLHTHLIQLIKCRRRSGCIKSNQFIQTICFNEQNQLNLKITQVRIAAYDTVTS